MLKIKIGDYFKMYKEGVETTSVIAISHSNETDQSCRAISLKPYKFWLVDVENEIIAVSGNIYD